METLDILIVDDNELVRTGIARVLKHAGYNVSESGNAKDALQMLAGRQVAPRIIISDYRMPEMNGANFVKAVRVLAFHKKTPILMVSSEIDPHCKEEAASAGINGWIAKSAIARELLPTVRRYFNAA